MLALLPRPLPWMGMGTVLALPVKARITSQSSTLRPSKSLTPGVLGDRPTGAALSPDGRTLAVSELGDDVIRLIDVASYETMASVSVPDRPYGVAFTP